MINDYMFYSYAWSFSYGNIVPTTTSHQLICVFYTLIGLGIMMIFLANIGDLVKQR
jgi:hypothetical protein